MTTALNARIRPTLCLSLAVLCLAAASPALATPKEEARKLFKEGNRLNAAGDHKGALDRYIRARGLYPSYKIDLNIAAMLYTLGRLTHAVIYYERFLERAGDSADRQAVVRARARLGELRGRLSSLTVSCSEAGARVTVDGKLVGHAPLQRRIYLEPGERSVLVETAVRVLLRRKLDLVAGAHEDLVITGRGWVKRPTDDNTDVPPGETRTPFEDRSRAAPRADDRLHEVRRRKAVLGWTFLGASLATGAAAAVLYGLGATEGARAHEAYMAARRPDDILARWDEVEAAQAKVVAGHVLAGATALCLGVAIYQLVTRPGPVASTPGVEVGPAATPGGAALWIRGSF